MTLELLAAVLLGALVLWMVVGPLMAPRAASPVSSLAAVDDVVPPEETRRGQALLALKELEFDLATGKIADADYHHLRERFVVEALEVMRSEDQVPGLDAAEAFVAARAAAVTRGAEGPTCPACGPRPEADAAFCSECGRRLAEAACAGCGEALGPGVRFCPSCGARVTAAA